MSAPLRPFQHVPLQPAEDEAIPAQTPSLRPQQPSIPPAGNSMRPVRAPKPLLEDTSTLVRAEDLESLPIIHQMLRLLNDAFVGAPQLADKVKRIAPLAARVTRRFAERFGGRATGNLAEQLARLGNREFEFLLLTFLEDLTVLRAEMDDPSGDEGSGSGIEGG